MSPNVHSSIDSFWNDARVIKLRGLFDRGLSTQRITVEMGLKSRNAVNDKLRLLGLRREPKALVFSPRIIVNRVQRPDASRGRAAEI